MSHGPAQLKLANDFVYVVISLDSYIILKELYWSEIASSKRELLVKNSFLRSSLRGSVGIEVEIWCTQTSIPEGN